jgi:replicative DNA helicase
MSQNVDFTLLAYATQGKNFAAELATQTRETFYDHETRIPIKILIDYYKTYKTIPSYEVACEYAESYPQSVEAKQTLKRAYDVSNEELVIGDFPFYVDRLKKKYNNTYIKERIDYASKTLAGQYELEDVNDFIHKTALELSSIETNKIREQGTLQESAQQRLVSYKERKEHPELSRGVYSGFKKLDEITNGFRGSELILISGPTGSGKSILLMNIAINAWLGNNTIAMSPDGWDDSGNDIWFITIENPKDMLERRIDSCIAGVASDHIRDGTLTPEEEVLFRQSLRFQYEYGKKKKFYISDLGRGVSMAMVEAEYERIRAEFSPKIILIDYLNIMQANNPSGSDWLDQGSISSEMHEFARLIKDAPVISASQMKSGMRTQNGIKRFTGDPESVARSKMITDNVNLNIQIKKDEDFHISSYIELCIAKNRDGRTGDVFPLIREFWRQRVSNPDANFKIPTNSGDDE